jgi:hypothetical protein
MEGDAQRDTLGRWAAMTAVTLAVLAALAGTLGQNSSNAVLEFHGKANLDKIEMADQWALYQARRIKLAVYTAHADLLQRLKLGPPPAEFEEDIAEYTREQQAIQAKAAALQSSADAHTRSAAVSLRQSDRYDLSVALFQLAIALVSLATLLKQRKVFFTGLTAGLGGMIVALSALLTR